MLRRRDGNREGEGRRFPPQPTRVWERRELPSGVRAAKKPISVLFKYHITSIYRRDDSSIGDYVCIGLFVEFRGTPVRSPLNTPLHLVWLQHYTDVMFWHCSILASVDFIVIVRITQLWTKKSSCLTSSFSHYLRCASAGRPVTVTATFNAIFILDFGL